MKRHSEVHENNISRVKMDHIIRRISKTEFKFEGFPDLQSEAYFLVSKDHISVSSRFSIHALIVGIGDDRISKNEELAKLFDKRKIEDDYSFNYISALDFYAEDAPHPDLSAEVM